MDELQQRGGKLLYDPELIVQRRPRSSLKAFCRMLLNYGRGRAEQFRETPTLGSALNFVPPVFLVYLVVLPMLTWWFGPLVLALLAVYALVVLLQVLVLVPRGGVARSLSALPLIVLTHVLYGFGFWRGLFTKLKSPSEPSNVPVQVPTAQAPPEHVAVALGSEQGAQLPVPHPCSGSSVPKHPSGQIFSPVSQPPWFAVPPVEPPLAPFPPAPVVVPCPPSLVVVAVVVVVPNL